jgi:hypothetical protein
LVQHRDWAANDDGIFSLGDEGVTPGWCGEHSHTAAMSRTTSQRRTLGCQGLGHPVVELSADALHARGGEARKHHYGIEEAREAKAQWCGWMDGIE